MEQTDGADPAQNEGQLHESIFESKAPMQRRGEVGQGDVKETGGTKARR